MSTKILYFSGTGNSLAVAREFVGRTGGEAAVDPFGDAQRKRYLRGRGAGSGLPRLPQEHASDPRAVRRETGGFGRQVRLRRLHARRHPGLAIDHLQDLVEV